MLLVDILTFPVYEGPWINTLVAYLPVAVTELTHVNPIHANTALVGRDKVVAFLALEAVSAVVAAVFAPVDAIDAVNAIAIILPIAVVAAFAVLAVIVVFLAVVFFDITTVVR